MHALPPPPVAVSELPPAPVSAHASSAGGPLPRRRGLSWSSFGGDGLMVSLAAHGLLAIVALTYAVGTYVGKPELRRPDPVFEPGTSKSGPRSPTPGVKVKPRVTTGKTTPKLTVNRPDASVSLPATPEAAPSFGAVLSASGPLGGQGGIGDVLGGGPGKSGSHLNGMFGVRGLLSVPGLPGTFYDCKQLPGGAPSVFAEDSSNPAYVDKVLRAFVKNWDAGVLEKFFKAPERLVAGQLFIPKTGADGAPEAYGVADKCKGRRWVAHYKGTVMAPKTGRFRFVVMGDDALAVRFGGKMVADGGFTVLGFPGHLSNFNAKPDAKRPLPPGITEDTYKGEQAPPFRCGTWIDVVKGREYPLEVVLSEIPGGLFSGYLLMEESESPNSTKGDGKLFLFRMNSEDLPEGIRQDTGLSVDMSGRELVWRAKSVKAPVR